MMNKYVLLIIFAVVVIGGGIAYKLFFLKPQNATYSSGEVKAFTVTAKKDQWAFAPEDIEVNRGDKVELTVINEDDYDHGIAIDAFGVSQRMPANQTIHVSFTATQPGDFAFYCSVPCGEGDTIVDGKKVHRGHFDMVGKLHVKDLISNPQ